MDLLRDSFFGGGREERLFPPETGALLETFGRAEGPMPGGTGRPGSSCSRPRSRPWPMASGACSRSSIGPAATRTGSTSSAGPSVQWFADRVG